MSEHNQNRGEMVGRSVAAVAPGRAQAGGPGRVGATLRAARAGQLLATMLGTTAAWAGPAVASGGSPVVAAALPAPEAGLTAPTDPQARTSAAAPAAVGFDVELDPLAFALAGSSLHLGVWYAHLRFDFGVFSLGLPEWMHGNAGMEARFEGFGGKVDWQFGTGRGGAFVGVEAGALRMSVQAADGQSDQDLRGAAGVRAGYRFVVAERVTITPWIGLGHTFGADTLRAGDQVFESSAWTVFPTVHVGYLLD